jgi:predicted RNA-binding Zn ribbon-like protein
MSSKTATSSQRLGLDPAPGGLCIVQDLINTDAIPAFEVPDLLGDRVVALSWLTAALREWSERTGQREVQLALSARDVAALRRLRGDLRHWVRTGDMSGLDVPARTLSVGVEAGHPVYGPHGDGAAGLTALIVMEILLASRAGIADRLRVCRNDACSAAFFDQSRNGSRVWHDVSSCGNIANLRAARARRKGSTVHRDGSIE